MKATHILSPQFLRTALAGLVLVAASACSSAPVYRAPLPTLERPIQVSTASVPFTSAPVALLEAGMDDERKQRLAERRRERHEKGFAKQGFFFGAESLLGFIDGDFDGNAGIVDPSGNVIVLPDLDEGAGLGLRAGYRFQKRAVELSVQYIEHDGTFGALSPDVELVYVNLAVKEYFLYNTPFQPYLMLGVSSIWGDIEDGAFEPTLTNSRTADIIGNSGNVGGGFAFLPFPNLSLDFSATYRVADISEAVGVSTVNQINHDVDISGWMFGWGITWTL